jgi:hypothetical protein
MERIDRLHHKDKASKKSSKVDARVDEAPWVFRRAALFLWNGLVAQIYARAYEDQSTRRLPANRPLHL